MTTLLTSATVTIGRLRYDAQIRAVTVTLALLPGVGQAEVTLAAGVNVEATPGDDAEVTLDGGDGAATVLTGRVHSVRRRSDRTVVHITDGGARLAATRPAETYQAMPATAIIMALAKAADVDTGLVIAPLQTAAYIADPGRTGAEHVAALAFRAGSVAAVDAGGRLNALPWPTGIPTAAMRRDREFLALGTAAHQPSHEFVLVGAGGSGVAAAPDGWLVNADAVATGDEPDPTRSWTPDPMLRTVLDVDTANRSAAVRRGAATTRMTGTCWLQPARRPGDIVAIQQGSADEAGPWLFTRVQHRLAPDGAVTTVAGISGGDTADLLGAAIGAL